MGPDFVVPAPPDVGRYTKERLVTRTSSADSHNGRAEHFVNGRDVPAEWWQLFRSPALNSLVRKSIAANPNLQATMAALAMRTGGRFFKQSGTGDRSAPPPGPPPVTICGPHRPRP